MLEEIKNPQAEEPINPLDLAQTSKENGGADDFVKSVVSTETGEGVSQLLESAPEIDMSLLAGLTPKKSILLLVLKIMFGVLVFLSVSSWLFFSSQLTNTFDFVASTFSIPNISKELSASNSEIIGLQTDLNFYRFLQIKENLSEFSYYGDVFSQAFDTSNSQTASQKEKTDSSAEMDKLRNSLRESYIAARDYLSEDFNAELASYVSETGVDSEMVFLSALNLKLNEKIASLADNNDPDALNDHKSYMQTKNIVGNVELKNLVLNTDFDALSNAGLYDFIKELNSLVVNDLSVIQSIKDKRIKWSDIIDEIELRTIAIDSLHSASFFDDVGGIRYTSYDFDTASRKVSIVGEIKRFDTTNFSMISNLIDELNKSAIFDGAEMKSFSKAGSTDEGYVSSLKLSLQLVDESNDILQ